MTQQPTVFLLDDDEGMRDSLRWLFESHGFLVDDFESPQALLNNYDPGRPGCMVIDLQLPGMTGLDVYDDLCRRGCKHPFVMITGFGDVSSAVRAMRSGAIDFIEKPFSEKHLLNRVREAIEKDDGQREVRRETDLIRIRIDSLSPRERQIMALVADGKLTKQIAGELGITVKTVEVHRSNLTKKMGVRSVIQLVNLLNRLSVDSSAK